MQQAAVASINGAVKGQWQWQSYDSKKFCVVSSCGGSCSHGLFQLVAAVVAVMAVDCGPPRLGLWLLRLLVVAWAVAVIYCGCCGCWLWLLWLLIANFFAVNDHCCHGHWLLSSWMWLSRSLIVVGLLVNCWFHGGWFAVAVIYQQDKGRGKDNSIISCLFQQRVLVAVAEILTADMTGENTKIIYNQLACRLWQQGETIVWQQSNGCLLFQRTLIVGLARQWQQGCNQQACWLGYRGGSEKIFTRKWQSTGWFLLPGGGGFGNSCSVIATE